MVGFGRLPESRNRVRCFFAIFLIVSLTPNDRSEDHDSLFAFLDEASQLVPGAKTCDVAGIRPLRSNQQNVVQTVTMESPDSLEVRRERFALAGLQRGNELLGCAICNF